MKRWKGLFLAGILLCGLSAKAQTNSISLNVDGQPLLAGQSAMMQGGRVMVPMRPIFQHLGATVVYDPGTRSIDAQRGKTEISLMVGSLTATVNGNPQTLDAPAEMMNGQIFVPLRFVSEALGADVRWIASTKTVDILSRTGGPEALSPSSVPEIPQSASRLIHRISAYPALAMPGQTVTITMNGKTGGTALLTLANGRQINMQEMSPGHYSGTYLVPANSPQGAIDVTVNLALPNGQTDTMTTGNAFSIQQTAQPLSTLPGGMLPLEVISPNPAANVSALFDVTGQTTPGAVVRIRLLANHKDEVYNSQTVADNQGNFHFPIDASNLHHNTHLILFLTSENGSGQTSKEIRMELTRQ